MHCSNRAEWLRHVIITASRPRLLLLPAEIRRDRKMRIDRNAGSDLIPLVPLRQKDCGRDLTPMRASASDTPCARQRGAWFQSDQCVSGSKCVRRTGHRFDCKTATVEVRKRIATKNHQVWVALVNPERDLHSAVRISELHTSEAILIALKVGERMVEPRRADPPRMLKIVFRALHVFRSDGKAALVGSLDGSPRNTQHQVVDRFGPKR
jgi:hypothetical protein